MRTKGIITEHNIKTKPQTLICWLYKLPPGDFTETMASCLIARV